MNFAIYCRKSKYTQRGESIENQIDYCTRYINLTFKDTTNTIVTYLDDGYSGKNLDRPSFKKMLHDCYSNAIDYIVVYRLDRISRNVSDFANLYQELLNLNVGFISTSEKYDTSTSGGRAMLFMACVFAQLERETVSERVKDNMYSLAKTGRWLGGIAPTGYTSTSYFENGKIKYRLTFNEDIKVVELIFKKYLESFSISKVEEYLYQVKIKSTNGNYYSRSSIKTILENPVYCKSDRISYEYLSNMGCNMNINIEDCLGNGYIVYGRTSNNGGRVQKRTTSSNWIVSIGEHLGIVEGSNWVDIQRFLHTKNYKSRSIHNSNSLLSGSFYCPVCNSKMISRTKSHGFVYACSNKLKYGTKVCKSSNIDGSLDNIILKNVFSANFPNKDILPQLETLKKSIKSSNVDIQKEIVLKKLSKSKKLLISLDKNSNMFKEVSKEYEELSEVLRNLEDIHLDFNLDIKNFLLEEFNNLPISVKREFLKDIVCNIEIL